MGQTTVIKDQKQKSFKRIKLLMGYLGVVILFISFLSVWVGGEIYRRNYRPDISWWGFFPTTAIVAILSSTAIVLTYGIVFWGMFNIYFGLVRKDISLYWLDWELITGGTLTLVMVPVVFIADKIYRFYHPLEHSQELVEIYFVCVATGFIFSVGSTLVFDYVCKNYLGLKVRVKNDD